MIVDDLDAMERIVNRTHNLVWDGYDVLQIRKMANAFSYKDGRRINGKWYRTRRFVLNRAGWKVPNGFGKA